MSNKNFIFLIDGASGTGKSDFLKYIKETTLSSITINKYTTRKQRCFEKDSDYSLDLDFYSSSDFNKLKLDYMYEYGDNYYGLKKSSIDDALCHYSLVFIVIRSVEVIKKIKNDFSDIDTISVYIHSDMKDIKQRLINQHYNIDEIEFRLSRIEHTYQDYISNSNIYDEVLINNSNILDYQKILDNLLSKYTSTT